MFQGRSIERLSRARVAVALLAGGGLIYWRGPNGERLCYGAEYKYIRQEQSGLLLLRRPCAKPGLVMRI